MKTLISDWIRNAQELGDGDVALMAPQERAEPAELDAMSRFVRENPLFKAILESVDGYLMILNGQRQILAANRRLLDEFGVAAVEEIQGFRPGEAIGCAKACLSGRGCGSARECSSCGALLAILASQREQHSINAECLSSIILDGHPLAREFRVRATPVRVEGREFTVLVLNDISGQKRREALERTFFHDVMNTLSGLIGWCEILHRFDHPNPGEIAERVLYLSHRLKDEIDNQRELVRAERGELEVRRRRVFATEILDAMRATFEAHDAARDRTLRLDPPDAGEWLETDPTLLRRVLVNMIKNALEAVGPGETVRLWYAREGDRAVFRVHNAGMIPAEVAPRVFQRSFSTKATHGRGIGTYGMKLFGERYLGGRVEFETSEAGGTVFRISLPAAESDTDSLDDVVGI